MSEPVPVVVVDSSVVYKWFNTEGESGVDTALELLAGHMSGTVILAAPAHMPSEVVNGLRYATLEIDTLHTAVEALSGAEIVTFPLDADLLSAALSFALTYDLTIHDALFPALAARLDCDLATSDRTQARVEECPMRLLV